MNIRPNLHNAVMIIGLAILGLIAFKLLSKTAAAKVPVLGSVVNLGAAA